MRPRHAAALALVGWYLMLPDVLPHVGSAATIPSNRLFDLNASIAKWTQWEALDSARDCQDERVRLLNKTNSDSLADDDVEWSGRLAFAKCVATDDPRLKGN